MQTTGTVLLNARGVNINGYDCFVNLSKPLKKSVYDIVTIDHESSPFSGYPIIEGIDSSTTKVSSCSLAFSNNYAKVLIVYPQSTVNLQSGFTIAFWSKMICFNTSTAQANGWYNPAKVIINLNSSGYNNLVMAGSFGAVNKNSFIQEKGSNTYSSTERYQDTDWHYYALVKVGNSLSWFIDGVLMCSRNISNDTQSDFANILLTFYLYSHYSYSYYDDIVYIKDQALWTSNFTPPTTYLLDSEYAMDLDKVKRRNIILANVDKKLIIPDEDPLKQY